MPKIFNPFYVITTNQIGTASIEPTGSVAGITFIYPSSSFTSSLDTGSLGSIEAVLEGYDANNGFQGGGLQFRVPDSTGTPSTGSVILSLFHTGSDNEPRVGIGFDDPNEKPVKAFQIKTKKDSAEGTEIVLENSRTTTGAQVGDEAGKINFTINSSSFGLLTDGSVAQIKSIITGVGANGAVGKLVLAVTKDNNVEPGNYWSLGYGNGTEGGDYLPSALGFSQLLSGSIQLRDFNSSIESSFSLLNDSNVPTFVLKNVNNTDEEANLWITGSITASAFSGDGSGLTGIGDVTATGTPANGQVAVFDGATSIAGDSDFTYNGSTNTLSLVSGSIDYLAVNDTLQGNGAGFQFFAYNEDTAKVKFANWYTTGSNQYGMGMLWYETWFAAIDTDGDANDVNRRIGFYLEEPNAGATDTVGGTGKHPTNARFYVDVNGGYLSGSFTASGDMTSNGYGVVSQSGDFVTNEFIIAASEHSVTSSDALAVDSAGNLGIGTPNPEVRLHMLGEAAQTTQILMEQFNNTADAPDIRTRRYRGTSASRADVQAGDYLFRLNVHGQDGGSSELYGSMQYDVSSTDQDACVWRIQTRDEGGTNATRLTIDKAGDATFAGDLAINGISNVSESIAAAGSGGGAVATYTNGSNDRIITSTGADGINGESTFTYNGTLLTLDGTMRFTPGTANNGVMTRVDNQWESTTLESNGEYIQVGTAISRTQHALYNLGTSGWVAADADAQSTSAGFLGIAVDGSSGNDFLIKGVYNTSTVDGSPQIGRPVYVSLTAGRVTTTAPSAAGDVIRFCGHIIDSFVSGRTTYWKIFFNPSPDFIEN